MKNRNWVYNGKTLILTMPHEPPYALVREPYMRVAQFDFSVGASEDELFLIIGGSFAIIPDLKFLPPWLVQKIGVSRLTKGIVKIKFEQRLTNLDGSSYIHS